MRPPQMSEFSMTDKSLGALLADLASHSASLVRDEVALARQEVREKGRELRTPLLFVAIGAAGLLVGVMCLVAAAILALTAYFTPWQAALIIGLALSLSAGALAAFGISQIKQTNLKPEQTLETLEENKTWLKEIA